MNALRADFDQPLAAVHHTRSPGARVEPVLGLKQLAREVALAVDDALRLAGSAAGERDQARVGGREFDRRRRARRRTATGPGSVSTRQSGRVGAKARRRLRSSATISFGCAAAIRRRRSLARSCSLHGRATAPRRKHATIVSTHSGRLPITVMTTSPAPTPDARASRRGERSDPRPRRTTTRAGVRRRASSTRARRCDGAAST